MMSDIQFDADKAQYAAKSGASAGYAGAEGNQPKMIAWLMRKGIVKSPAAGQVILVLLIIINIIVTLAVISYFL